MTFHCSLQELKVQKLRVLFLDNSLCKYVGYFNRCRNLFASLFVCELAFSRFSPLRPVFLLFFSSWGEAECGKGKENFYATVETSIYEKKQLNPSNIDGNIRKRGENFSSNGFLRIILSASLIIYISLMNAFVAVWAEIFQENSKLKSLMDGKPINLFGKSPSPVPKTPCVSEQVWRVNEKRGRFRNKIFSPALESGRNFTIWKCFVKRLRVEKEEGREVDDGREIEWN